MDTNRILAELRTERDRLNQVIIALESLDSSGSIAARRGRPRATAAPQQIRGGRRRISAAGRRRIAEAARAMWARRKKAAAANKAAPARHMSAATRKRLSELAKQRWALRRQAQKA